MIKREFRPENKVMTLILILMLLGIAVDVHVKMVADQQTMDTLRSQLVQAHAIDAQLAQANQLLHQTNLGLVDKLMSKPVIVPTETGYTATITPITPNEPVAVGIIATVGKMLIDGFRVAVAFGGF